MTKGGSVLQIFGLAGLIAAGIITSVAATVVAVSLVSIYVGIALER